MPKAPWRICLVGAGRGSGYGKLFADHPDCRIVACCDTSPDALAKLRKELGLDESQCFSDYRRMLGARPDAVFLGTPIPYHAEQTIQALEAGVAVLSEVTAGMTVDECRRIVEAVRRTGGVYMMAENCVYWPFIQEWKKLIRAGRIGEVFYAECEYIHAVPELIIDPKTGRKLWRTVRAPLHYCSHSIGPILHILGDRIVRAMGLGDGHRVLPEGGMGGIDIQVALFQTAGGVIIKMLRSSVAPRKPRTHFYNLQGTRGFIETDRLGPGGKGLLYVEGEMQQAVEIGCGFVDDSLPKKARAGGHGTSEYSLVEDFLRAMRTGEKPAIDVAAAMEMTVPGLIASDSAARGGVWMDVPTLI